MTNEIIPNDGITETFEEILGLAKNFNHPDVVKDFEKYLEACNGNLPAEYSRYMHNPKLIHAYMKGYFDGQQYVSKNANNVFDLSKMPDIGEIKEEVIKIKSESEDELWEDELWDKLFVGLVTKVIKYAIEKFSSQIHGCKDINDRVKLLEEVFKDMWKDKDYNLEAKNFFNLLWKACKNKDDKKVFSLVHQMFIGIVHEEFINYCDYMVCQLQIEF